MTVSKTGVVYILFNYMDSHGQTSIMGMSVVATGDVYLLCSNVGGVCHVESTMMLRPKVSKRVPSEHAL